MGAPVAAVPLIDAATMPWPFPGEEEPPQPLNNAETAMESRIPVVFFACISIPFV
jgi:hypothetical protein